MSQNFGIHRACACILALLLFGCGCDPCRQFAELACECKQDDEEKQACRASLSLPSELKGFKNARDEEVCKKALKDCDCKKLNDNQDAQCGMYR